MKMTLISIIILMTCSCFGQSIVTETINIFDWGTIKLPKSMEVQRGPYKRLLDESKKEFSINADRIVFQQKGLNNLNNFDTYARVIIRTDYCNPGDLPRLNELDLSQNELSETNLSYKQEIISVCRGTNATLLDWNDLTLISLNGYKCLYFNYTRQSLGKPSTYSEFYMFFNYNKQHTLNFEYHIKDKAKWEQELTECKRSFNFN